MEFASRLRWILVIIVGVLAIGLIAWGLLSIARGVFNTGSSGDESEEVVNLEPIYPVESAGKVRLTIDGPIVANEKHHSAVIEIAPSTVKMTVYKSYGQQTVSTKSYVNSNASYQAFLDALNALNVTERRDGTTEADDESESGVCSTGRRYILEIDSDLRRWATSCSTKQGNAGFSMSSVRKLIEKQVPDYRDILRGTGL